MALNSSKTKPWSISSFAYVGAFTGMVIAVAHHIEHTLTGDIPKDNLLGHIFLELVGSSLGVALVLAAIAVVRNRIVQRRT
jgi:hypothetical protein